MRDNTKKKRAFIAYIVAQILQKRQEHGTIVSLNIVAVQRSRQAVNCGRLTNICGVSINSGILWRCMLLLLLLLLLLMNVMMVLLLLLLLLLTQAVSSSDCGRIDR